MTEANETAKKSSSKKGKDFAPIPDKMSHPQLLRMVDRQQAKRASGKSNFIHAIYNPEEGKCLDRNCWEWGRVTIFYVAYYGILFGMTTLLFIIFTNAILDPNIPVWMGERAILGDNPSLRILAPDLRKIPPDNVFMVTYSMSDRANSSAYRESMRKIICRYSKQKKKVKKINDKQNDKKDGLFDCADPCMYLEKQMDELQNSCYYDVTDSNNYTGLGPCACKSQGCKKEEFGYNENGPPCVAVAINKLYDWMPNDILHHGSGSNCKIGDTSTTATINCSDPNHMITLKCEGKKEIDQEHLDSKYDIEVFPKNGISFCYFPFYNQPSYQQPFFMVRATPKKGLYVEVECRAEVSSAGSRLHPDPESNGGIADIDYLLNK